jgi:hypothetical protein
MRSTLTDQHEAMKKSAQSIWEAQLRVLKGDPNEDQGEDRGGNTSSALATFSLRVGLMT